MHQICATFLIWTILLNSYVTINAVNPCCSYPCQNRGICMSTGGEDEYECDCSRTGYFGKTCHRPTWGTLIQSFYALSTETKLNIVTGYAPMWFIINLIGFLHRRATAYIYSTRGETVITPHTYNVNQDYITADVYYNRSYYARDLPPVPCDCPTPMGTKGPTQLPAAKEVFEKILKREKFKPELYGSNLIFVGYAQHFIHQFFYTDYQRGDGFTLGDEGVDVSQVYGTDEATRRALRSNIDGKMKTRMVDGEEFPPFLEDAPSVNVIIPELEKVPETAQKWALGNPYLNRNPLTFVMSTIWIREHNRICDILRKKNPYWTDEKIYQIARLIITGEMLTITMSEYVQQLSQYNIALSYQPDLTHDINFQYSNRIRQEFNHLYHWHQMMPEEITVGNNTYYFRDIQFTGQMLIVQDGFDLWVEAMTNSLAGQITYHNSGPIVEYISKYLLEEGRNIRLQPFNNYRKRFGLQPYATFEELTGETEVAKILQQLYDDVDAVEFYVGLVCEKNHKSVTAPTTIALGGPWAIKGIMGNPIGSPHWWKKSTFGGTEGFEIVKTATLKKLFCANMKSRCKGFHMGYKVPRHILANVFPHQYLDSLNK